MKSILDRDNGPTVMRPVRDIAERNQIIADNLPLAYWCIGKLSHLAVIASTPPDLLEDAAVDGLFRAAELWRDDAGTRFSTYAVRAINSHIFNAAKRHAGGSKRPRKRVYLLLDVWGFAERDNDDNEPWQPAQPPPAEGNDNPDAGLIEAAMQRLSEADRTLLRQRFVNEMSMNKIGDERGICRERVRQLQGRALARLRREFDQLKAKGATA